MNYTTCRRCGEILATTFVGQETHPTCEQTDAEKLAREFVDAVQRHDAGEVDRLEKLVNQRPLPSLGKSALWYAKHGWPVLPLLPNSKLPATKHGLKDASTDMDRIDAWWKKHPESNIGIRTGVKFDVIDIDGPEGVKSLSELGDDALPDVHGKASTPRGMHFYVSPTGKGNRAGVRPGIDYRGVDGFCVAPPSQSDLKRWSWVMQPSPEILG